MERRNLVFVVAAVVVGLLAAYLANSYFSGVESREQHRAEQQRLARIVVASRPLDFGEPLTEQNVRLASFPASSIPDGAFHSIPDATRNGRVALRPIVANEPVLADKVSGTDGRAVLAANLDPGTRAVAIPVTPTSGVAGFVRPGDVVDVLLTRSLPGGAEGNSMMTDVILDRVKVLAIDQVANEKETKPKIGKNAVVQVDLFGAQKLALAEKLGTLSLALRNVQTEAQPAALTTVTARDLGAGGLRYAGYSAPRPARPAGPFAAPIPAFPQFVGPPAQRSGPAINPAPARPIGPTMTIYRGVQPTEESVGHLGGS